MTTVAADLEAEAVALQLEAAPTPLPLSTRWRIMAYLAVLIFMMAYGNPHGPLIGLPVSFFLKNKLHLKAHEVAMFGLIATAPVYVGFLFGFARDRWNPLGMKDRGFLAIFGAATALIYLAMAFLPVSYPMLLAGVVLLGVGYLFVLAAKDGLAAMIGRQHVMSGQVSTIWLVVASVPGVLGYLLGGLLSDLLEGENAAMAARILFLTGAAVMAAVAFYGLWRPKSVFDNLHAENTAPAHPLADLKRLARHWPIYPALGIWLLWNFAPGSVTSLQYYLQNTLHAKDAQWGQWNAIFAISFIPTFLLFGVLCRRFPLRTLLIWGTAAAIPQFIPLLFVHSVTTALIAAAPMGLMGGVATAAYMDLLIRSCPTGLQGTVLMFAAAAYGIDVRFGDVLGTSLYDHFGAFTACVIAITVVYALIMPLIFLVPRRLIATADGEAPEGGFG